VVDLTMKYLLPAKLDDDLVIISTVEELRAASVFIEQTIMRGSDKITSASVHAAFLSPSGRPRRQPKAWTKAFASVMDQTDRK